MDTEALLRSIVLRVVIFYVFLKLMIEEVSKERNQIYSMNEFDKDFLKRDCSLWEIPRDKFTIGHKISQDAFGTVYHALWDYLDVAVKVYPLGQPLHESLCTFRKEVSIAAAVQHSNMLQFLGYSHSPDDLCIITEILPRGSLFQLIHGKKSNAVWRRRTKIAFEIAKGMTYLHSCCKPPIIHRNLKSSNLLVDSCWTVKVGDFHLSCRKPDLTESPIGTPGWMSPEALCGHPCDEKMDVYSFGVVLWELATKKIPWEGLSLEQVRLKVGIQNERLEIPTDLDPQWASIIERCWQRDPGCRPSSYELLEIFEALQPRPKRRRKRRLDTHFRIGKTTTAGRRRRFKIIFGRLHVYNWVD